MSVVAVLLAAAGVGTGGLDMAGFCGADPDIFPGGRNGQRADAMEAAASRVRLPVGLVKREGFKGSAVAGDAGRCVGDVDEAGGFGKGLVAGVVMVGGGIAQFCGERGGGRGFAFCGGGGFGFFLRMGGINCKVRAAKGVCGAVGV